MARTLLDALKDRGARNRFQRERARGRVEGFWIAAVMTIIALVADRGCHDYYRARRGQLPIPVGIRLVDWRRGVRVGSAP
jgi:hypothetical protein